MRELRYDFIPLNREGYHYDHIFRIRDDGIYRSAYDPIPKNIVAWLEEHVGVEGYNYANIDGDICISGASKAFAFRMRWC